MPQSNDFKADDTCSNSINNGACANVSDKNVVSQSNDWNVHGTDCNISDKSFKTRNFA